MEIYYVYYCVIGVFLSHFVASQLNDDSASVVSTRQSDLTTSSAGTRRRHQVSDRGGTRRTFVGSDGQPYYEYRPHVSETRGEASSLNGSNHRGVVEETRGGGVVPRRSSGSPRGNTRHGNIRQRTQSSSRVSGRRGVPVNNPRSTGQTYRYPFGRGQIEYQTGTATGIAAAAVPGRTRLEPTYTRQGLALSSANRNNDEDNQVPDFSFGSRRQPVRQQRQQQQDQQQHRQQNILQTDGDRNYRSQAGSGIPTTNQHSSGVVHAENSGGLSSTHNTGYQPRGGASSQGSRTRFGTRQLGFRQGQAISAWAEYVPSSGASDTQASQERTQPASTSPVQSTANHHQSHDSVSTATGRAGNSRDPITNPVLKSRVSTSRQTSYHEQPSRQNSLDRRRNNLGSRGSVRDGSTLTYVRPIQTRFVSRQGQTYSRPQVQQNQQQNQRSQQQNQLNQQQNPGWVQPNDAAECPDTGIEVRVDGMGCSQAINHHGNHLCYTHEHSSRLCCEVCQSRKRISRTGCEYGDRNPQCASISAADCYDLRNRHTCCEACEGHKVRDAQQGCEYGDLSPLCDDVRVNTGLCYLPDNQRLCCATCNRFRNTSNPDCPWGDASEEACNLFDQNNRIRINCYSQQRRQMCCNSCERLRQWVPDGIPGDCEYGDRPVVFNTDRFGQLNCSNILNFFNVDECRTNPAVSTNCCYTCHRYLRMRGQG